MNDVNTITICRETYETQEDFENAVKKAVMVLLDNDYIMTVRYDEPGLGIVCIDFESNDPNIECNYPYWLSPAEYESIIFFHDEVVDDE